MHVLCFQSRWFPSQAQDDGTTLVRKLVVMGAARLCWHTTGNPSTKLPLVNVLEVFKGGLSVSLVKGFPDSTISSLLILPHNKFGSTYTATRVPMLRRFGTGAQRMLRN